MKYTEIFKNGMKHKVSIYIPGTVNADQADSKKAEEMTNHIASRFSDLFGGATITNASGAWMSDRLGLIQEDVKIIYSYCTETALNSNAESLMQLAEMVRDEMQQEAVSVEIDNTLYFV